MNNCCFSGYLSSDVTTYGQVGEKGFCARFSLALNSAGKDGKQKTDFIRIVAFGKQAEVIAKHFHKGSWIDLVARVTTSTYEKEGAKHYVTDFTLVSFGFGPKTGESSSALAQAPAPQASAPAPTTAPAAPANAAPQAGFPLPEDPLANVDDSKLPWEQ